MGFHTALMRGFACIYEGFVIVPCDVTGLQLELLIGLQKASFQPKRLGSQSPNSLNRQFTIGESASTLFAFPAFTLASKHIKGALHRLLHFFTLSFSETPLKLSSIQASRLPVSRFLSFTHPLLTVNISPISQILWLRFYFTVSVWKI